MKTRLMAVAGIAAASLVLAACGGDDNEPAQVAPADRTGTLNVWLMQDAEGEAWAPIVEQATAKFKQTYPKVNVQVTIQQWEGISDRLTTAFAGTTPPDVVELGNTLAPKYASDGALAELTANKGDFENSGSWLRTLEDAGTFEGKLYAVPYYAGSRVITYRKDMFDEAGITAIPTSMDELKAAADKLNTTFGDDPNFSAFYIPGQHWYLAGALIADQQDDQPAPFAGFTDGHWAANVTSPESVAGLTLFQELASKYSKADPTGNEADQANRMGGQGNIAMFYGAGWEMGVVTNEDDGDPKLADKLGQFPLPSVTPGQPAPAFLGGSVLGVSQKSTQQDLARAWIGAYTSNDVQTALVNATGSVPNTTTLLGLQPDNPAFQAASRTWFVPTSPNWASIEEQRLLQNALVSIATGQASVTDAANTLNQEVDSILDAS
ncbi:MAG: extracellular solute-binding protein [Sporichthyaceae bacterium]|nr:extracellular solute-binding protein [Sporichthyaceae bacterium]